MVVSVVVDCPSNRRTCCRPRRRYLGAGKTPAGIAECRNDHGLYATYLNGFFAVCHGSKDTLSGRLSNTGTACANVVEFVYLPRGTPVGYRPVNGRNLIFGDGRVADKADRAKQLLQRTHEYSLSTVHSERRLYLQRPSPSCSNLCPLA